MASIQLQEQEEYEYQNEYGKNSARLEGGLLQLSLYKFGSCPFVCLSVCLFVRLSTFHVLFHVSIAWSNEV